MAKKKFTKIGVAREYLDRFPRAATMTLAKKAMKENPSVWPSLNACRKSFRDARGASGNDRKGMATHVRKKGTPTKNPFGDLPKGLTEVDGWAPLQIDPPMRALVLSDVHVPYHNDKHVRLALEEAKARRCDAIVLNGDIMDCFALSRWEKDPRERDFRHEVDATRKLLEVISAAFPNARKVFKFGNHEERYQSYMQTKAPELLDIDDFQLESVLRPTHRQPC